MNLILSTVLLLAPAYADSTAANTSPALTDAQIAAVVRTADEGEIDSSKHAKSHAKNKQVKEFAKKMISHHKQSNKNAKKLFSKLEISPQKNDVSEKLQKSAKAEIAKLKGLKGADYDKAYIQSQLSMHESVLNEIDNTLLPSAKNAELKAMLEKTRETVAQHLDEAKSINASL